MSTAQVTQAAAELGDAQAEEPEKDEGSSPMCKASEEAQGGTALARCCQLRCRAMIQSSTGTSSTTHNPLHSRHRWQSPSPINPGLD